MSDAPTSAYGARSDSILQPSTITGRTTVSTHRQGYKPCCVHGCIKEGGYANVSVWKRHDLGKHQSEIWRCPSCHCEAKRKTNLRGKHIASDRTGEHGAEKVGTCGTGCGMCLFYMTNSKIRGDHILDHQQKEGKTQNDWTHAQEIRSLLYHPALLQALCKTDWASHLETLIWRPEDYKDLKELLEQTTFEDPALTLQKAFMRSYRDGNRGTLGTGSSPTPQSPVAFENELFPEQLGPSFITPETQTTTLDQQQVQGPDDSIFRLIPPPPALVGRLSAYHSDWDPPLPVYSHYGLAATPEPHPTGFNINGDAYPLQPLLERNELLAPTPPSSEFTFRYPPRRESDASN